MMVTMAYPRLPMMRHVKYECTWIDSQQKMVADFELVSLVGAAYLGTGFVYVRQTSLDAHYLRVPPSILKWPIETISNSQFSYLLMFALLVAVIICKYAYAT